MDIKTLAEKLQYVALYTAIAIIASCIVVGLLVWFFKREKFNDFKKYAIGIVTGFAATMLVVFSYVMFQRNINKMQAMLFYPILAMLIVVVAGGIAVLISSLFSNKAAKISLIVTGVLLLASFIAFVVVVWKYYNVNYDKFKKMYPGMSLIGMVVSAVVILAVLVAVWFVGDNRKLNDTRSIVYGAVAMALAFVLSYARLFKLPNGGSITFASLLPLMIYCCMFGTRRGLIVCSLYGVLQALQDPYIIHPMQFLLDYPLAFGLVGVSGIFMEKGVFKEKKILAFLLGGVVAVLFRYICHVCSGTFAFAEYTDFKAALAYSLGYNATYVFADMAISLVAGSFLFTSKSFTAAMQQSSDGNKLAAATQTADGATGVDNDEELDEVDKQIIANQAKSENKDSNDNQDNNR